jgi:hypothetical protein
MSLKLFWYFDLMIFELLILFHKDNMRKRKSEVDEDQIKKKMKVEHAEMEIEVEGKSNEKIKSLKIVNFLLF